tara:strand:- start:291 stop:437 length:147 start_codon:yes stop_codon:yes gene_type:complete
MTLEELIELAPIPQQIGVKPKQEPEGPLNLDDPLDEILENFFEQNEDL